MQSTSPCSSTRPLLTISPLRASFVPRMMIGCLPEGTYHHPTEAEEEPLSALTVTTGGMTREAAGRHG